MTKALIITAIVVVVGLGAWQLLEYWQKISDDKEAAKQQAASQVVTSQSLPGLNPALENSLQSAEQGGANALGNWLKNYGAATQDPRKAWIELDYVLMIARDKPQEAKRIFNDVRDRTLPNSPVWPRIQGMQKSFQ